jgi:hypothetical protein
MVLSKDGTMRVLVLFFSKQQQFTRSIPETGMNNSTGCAQNARQPKLLHRLPGQHHLQQQPKLLYRLMPRKFPVRGRSQVLLNSSKPSNFILLTPRSLPTLLRPSGGQSEHGASNIDYRHILSLLFSSIPNPEAEFFDEELGD